MNSRSDILPAFQPLQPNLRTNWYDRWAAGVVATLVCLCLLLSGLLVVWLSLTAEMWATFSRTSPGTAEIEVFGGQGSGIPPMPELSSPEDEQTDADLAREMSVLLNHLDGQDAELIEGVPGDSEGLEGTKRGPKTTIVGPPPKAKPNRWVFRIDQIATLDAYAKLLDDTGIELGTFDATGFVYLTDVSRKTPRVRRATTSTDERFFTRWQSGTLAKLDHDLFQRAGITSVRPEIVHFFPGKLERRLIQLEINATHSASQRMKNIRRTLFGVRKNGRRFEFFVVKQQFKER